MHPREIQTGCQSNHANPREDMTASFYYHSLQTVRSLSAYNPIDLENATVICFKESRAFLKGIGINGEIVRTPSHSQDSISLILDSGECFVGDLEPNEYLDGYENNESLQNDWKLISSYIPKVIYYAHANQKMLK